MPGFKKHLKHSMDKYPDIDSKRHEQVHKWMDNPTQWAIKEEYREMSLEERKKHAKKKKRSNTRIQRKSSKDKA